MTIRIWSTYPPALTKAPLGGLRIVAGTVYKMMQGENPLAITTTFPEGTVPQDFEWVRPERIVTEEGPLTAEFAYGSKGDIYIVETWRNKRPTCTCTGYSYRRTCKHIQ